MNEADTKARDVDEKGRKGRRPVAAAPSADPAVTGHIGVTDAAANDVVVDAGAGDIVPDASVELKSAAAVDTVA